MGPSSSQHLSDLLISEALPTGYGQLIEQWFVPLADWLQARQVSRRGEVMLVGVHGAQGTGKSTLCKVLEILLSDRQLTTVTLSLDDFYLTQAERRQLAESVHPLFKTRGVPGTHDVALLNQMLDALLAGKACATPRFDKSQDDRLPHAEWPLLPAPDIVLLEGWCVGAQPEPSEDLVPPANALEAQEDAGAQWRTWVNNALANDYAGLFGRLDYLVMLESASWEVVLQWRSEQERKLADSSDPHTPRPGLMNDAELKRFVQHYERITRCSLATLPQRADYLLRLNSDHGIDSVLVR